MSFRNVLLLIAFPCFAGKTNAQGIVLAASVDTCQKIRQISSIPSTFNQRVLIAPDHYTKHFGFFCRQELKLDKAHVPITFRLGNMDLCNKLEDKPGYR